MVAKHCKAEVKERINNECNQDIENTSHFLFTCPRFANHRANLADTVIEILRRNNLNHLGN